MRDTFSHSPLPRYAQLADLLRQRIARGVWKEGDLLPSLDALVAEFGVARVTVRQAIERLARENLVSPQRGRGTFVTAQAGPDRWLRLETNLRDLADVYREDKPKLTLIEDTAAMPALRERDGLPAPGYRFLRRVHSRQDVAYCVISIHLDERVFRLAPQRFLHETVIPVLLELPQVQIARAWQTLSIATADLEVAQLLEQPLNAPVAEVRRVVTAPDGTVLYLGEITYRGDYIHFEMDLVT
ncbi:MAG: GntR family transcriptional regulator [Rubrivivax sp.]